MRRLRIEVISSGRSFKALSPCREFLAEPVEAAAHAGVEAQRAGLEDEVADQVGVDALRRLPLAAGSQFDLGEHAVRLPIRVLDGCGPLGGGAALAPAH